MTKKLKIKTREEMLADGGSSSSFGIYFPGSSASFVNSMERQMPEDRIIKVTKNDALWWWNGWIITKNMTKYEIFPTFLKKESKKPVLERAGREEAM